MGGERRKKEGKGEREGRKGTEEGPTKNSCRGAQNVKLRHCSVLDSQPAGDRSYKPGSRPFHRRASPLFVRW